MSIEQPPDRVYGMRIVRDGTWFHEGSPIKRMELVKLFASVLRRDEQGDFWLITPAERGRIEVEDAPFVAVAVRFEGSGDDQKLVFRTNIDQEVVAGPAHPIRVETAPLSGEPSPYILLQERVEARISRAVFYDLVEHAVERPTARGTEIGIWSDRTFFALGTIPPGESERLTPADIRRRFAGEPPAPRSRGDHELNPDLPLLVELRAAAVLVPLVDRDWGLSILLTQRTEHLAHHAGQIAFPGGGVEKEDADVVAAALRETKEEIGLDRSHIDPVGQLDRYVTRTGFTVTPVVAIVTPPFELTLEPSEVADSFEVPLDFILDPANRQRHSIEFEGLTRNFYAFIYGDRNIWGATAGMLVDLAERLVG